MLYRQRFKQLFCFRVTQLTNALLVVLLLVSCQLSAQQQHLIGIFTLDNTLQQISKSKARMLYRGKVKSLNSVRIELSDWSTSSDLRRDFYLRLLGKDNAQMNAYWAGISFSGKARPPKEINQDSMQDLLQWLSAKEGRIGYALLEEIPQNANILYVVKQDDL